MGSFPRRQTPCPNCGRPDRLATIEQVEAYSEIDMAGEYTGMTTYSDFMVTIGEACLACGWEIRY